MSIIRITMVMVGPHATRSQVINGYRFVHGRCQLVGSVQNVSGGVRYLASYQAYPEGSDELRAGLRQYAKGLAEIVAGNKPSEQVKAIKALAALDKDGAVNLLEVLGAEACEAIGRVVDKMEADRAEKGADHGTSHPDPDPIRGSTDPVSGDVQPDPATPVDGDDGGRPADPASDGAGAGAEGYGPGRSALIGELQMALGELDDAVDSHWTASGQPLVSFVSGLLGVPITRADIDQAAPGLVRGGKA